MLCLPITRKSWKRRWCKASIGVKKQMKNDERS
jgi:hypothetical protein